MSIPLRTIQLLEVCACDPLSVVDPSLSPATQEGGSLALEVGVTSYTVPFTVAKITPNYDFAESYISNSVDPNPFIITPTMSNQTENGFMLQLNSNPDTVNYVFHWLVKVMHI